MRAVYLVLGLLVFLFAINFLDKCEEGKFLRFAGKDYCVPRASSIYMSGGGFFNALFLPPSDQLDSGENQQIFVVSSAAVRKAIPGVQHSTINDGSVKHHLQFLVFSLSKEDLEKTRFTSTAIINMVLGIGEWSNYHKGQQVSALPFTDWMRISYDSDRDGTTEGSWYIFKEYPEISDGYSSNPGNFIGNCMYQNFKIHSSETTCRVRFVDKESGFLIKFWLTEDSLYLKDQVGAYLVQQIRSWEFKESEKN